MSKDTKVEPVKSEVQEELDELAEEDDGSKETEEEETEEDGSESEEEESEEEDDAGARERDGKGRFKKVKDPTKPAKKDEKADEEEEEEEETEADGSESEEEESEEEETEEETGPKSRSSKKIQQLVNSRNKANQRIAHLEGQIAALAKGDKKDEPVKVKTAKEVADELRPKIEELREKAEEARADSNIKEAAKLQGQIDDLQEQVRDAKTAESEARAKGAARMELENERFNTALDLLIKVRPIVDQESEEFNPHVYKELAFQVESYEKNGLTPYAALRRACRFIFEQDPFEKPTADDDVGAKKGKKPEKKETDVKKNVAAAKKQPPRGGKHVQEEGTGEVNVDDLTDEELLALPASKLARMDGSLG